MSKLSVFRENMKDYKDATEGMDSENITIFVKDAQGNWNEREFTVIGSYLAFDFADGDQGFALYEKPASSFGIVIVAMAVAVILAVAIFIRKKK